MTVATGVWWDARSRAIRLIRYLGPTLSFAGFALALFIVANRQIALYPTWNSLLGGW